MITGLKACVEQIAAESGAHMGVAIHHIETGQEVMLNADELFALASVVKVPVLVEAFRQIEENRLRLTDRWTLVQEVKALGSGILTELDNGLPLTVQDLLVLMIIISDNTATDMLMQRLGIDNIDRNLHALGFENIHTAHTLTEIFTDMLPSADPNQDRSKLAAWEAEHGVNKDGWAYRMGPENNVGSPRDLTCLMTKIYKGEIISRSACDQMLAILLRQHLNDRIPRFLPLGTKVAHKTGTFSGVRNDSGIIYVNDNSHVAVTILSRWDHDAVRKDPVKDWERSIQIDSAMGKIALAAYEAFS
ncbi:MAG: serine hydrolase [Chloroflexi bacterium]|nr:serine hydrolase [Chloroflexota bacterium]